MQELFDKALSNHPRLVKSRDSIHQAFELMKMCFDQSGKLLVCGNGGSAADAEHIVCELMKNFSIKREDNPQLKQIKDSDIEPILKMLQSPLRAISLCSQTALMTAIANDQDAELIFAQQVLAYGDSTDILLTISTSGVSPNVLRALELAKIMGLKTIGLTGRSGGKMRALCDVCIAVDSDNTGEIQELHLPVYHLLCAMLEQHYFGLNS